MINKKQYIHYCWFGGKKLSSLAERCIKSWQEYLPDYEIKRWDESNCNFNECSFVKQMYKEKKWAFVADYFRTKVLYEYGGIYLDTDMEIKKDITELLKDKTFLGVEDTGYVAVGVWYEKFPHAKLPAALLDTYRSIEYVDTDKLGNYSIPRLISQCLEKYNVKKNSNEIQKLKDGIVIYPREYFYPLSYGHDNNCFTDNTHMVHYYDASWINNKKKLELYLVRKIGRNNTLKIEKTYAKGKSLVIKVVKVPLFPVVIYRKRQRKLQDKPADYDDRIHNTIKTIADSRDKNITIYNKYWLGTASSTKELFQNTIDCGEIFYKKDIANIKDAIFGANIKKITFSAFADGWDKLVKEIKKARPNIQINVLWHGNNSQILDSYGWKMNRRIIKLYENGKIDNIASCKKSLAEYYNRIGIKTYFLTNSVNIKPKKQQSKSHNKTIRVGIYAAKCSDWRKNMFSQIAAVGQIKNAIIDMVPLDPAAQDFAQKIGVKIEGSIKPLSRKKLIERMAQNSVNLYVTFSECAPMLPLESMSVGVPCLTGDNHHYFKDQKLEEYLVVSNECDISEISRRITNAIAKKAEIINLYQKFISKNAKLLKVEIRDFMEEK